MRTLGRAARTALYPAAVIYGGAAALRRAAYDRGWLARVRLPVEVISVGSLTLGGAGKTPVTRWVAEQLQARGVRTAVVTGAYGGSSRACTSPVPADAWLSPGGAARLGDESVLLARWLPGVDVLCGRDKAAAARAAADAGAQVVVIDDGFQHQRLARDLDIVVASRGDEAVPLPAGDGRELPIAARHADLRWLHGRAGEVIERAADVRSVNEATAVERLGGGALLPPSALAGASVYLVAGVARPGDFEAMVRGLGARVVGRCMVRDHQRPSVRALRRAARSRADLLLCTEKDAVRLAGDPNASALHALACRVAIVSGARLVDQLLDDIAARGASSC